MRDYLSRVSYLDFSAIYCLLISCVSVFVLKHQTPKHKPSSASAYLIHTHTCTLSICLRSELDAKGTCLCNYILHRITGRNQSSF